MKAHMIRKMSEVIQKQRNQSLNIQTEPVVQRCSYKKTFWNMKQVCQKKPIPKCDFHVEQSNFIETTLRLGYSFVNSFVLTEKYKSIKAIEDDFYRGWFLSQSNWSKT